MDIVFALIISVCSLAALALGWQAYQAATELHQQVRSLQARLGRLEEVGATKTAVAQLAGRAVDPVVERAVREIRTLSERIAALEQTAHVVRDESERVRTNPGVSARSPEPVLSSIRHQPDGAVPAQEPALVAGQPVEVGQGVIVPSRSLAAIGSLVITDPVRGEAEVSINSDVEIDHLTFEKWADYFDFGNGKPYMRYRTRRPSIVAWNPAAEQGRLIRKGIAEALS